jgi:3-oxo-4-pregnene-20-carboxyl-CoA dehydrogenase beta subunit
MADGREIMAEKNAGASEEERRLLRDSVRGFLSARWPVEHAVERGIDPAAVKDVWRGLGAQGLTALGSDPEEAGLGEILLVLDELGRASCPVPLPGAVVANLALRGRRNANRATDELLDGLRQGTGAVAVALGAFDGDPAAGRVEYANGALTGRIAFVEGAAVASHVLVMVDDPSGVAILPADAPGFAVTPTPGLAVPALSELSFAPTQAAFVALPASSLTELALVMRLACAARASGAARRGFELAIEHAKLRKQFGQLIGQFQAIQHKLVNCLIQLDGARLTLDSAAAAYDRGDASWRVFAAAALAFAGPALRQVALEAHHTLGAIGYAEEHEMPRHFRRVHADLARFGGAPRARAELADYLLGPTA